jgi:hypothetical protein
LANEGVTLPDQPEGTVQVYWPEPFESGQLPPFVAAKVHAGKRVAPTLTVPLSVRSSERRPAHRRRRRQHGVGAAALVTRRMTWPFRSHTR